MFIMWLYYGVFLWDFGEVRFCYFYRFVFINNDVVKFFIYVFVNVCVRFFLGFVFGIGDEFRWRVGVISGVRYC